MPTPAATAASWIAARVPTGRRSATVGRLARAAVAAATAAGVLAVGGCASGPRSAGVDPGRLVEALGKVVDTLAAETAQRLAAAAAGRTVVVLTRPDGDHLVEHAVGELLRTRLVERGTPVAASCPARCFEIRLLEFAGSAPASAGVTAGQVFQVAAGAVPVLGGLSRTLSERERGGGPARTSALFVTFAARDDGLYAARSHLVAIVAAEEAK